MKTISTKIAASDIIKKIDEKIFVYKLYIVIAIIALVANIIGLLTQWLLISGVIIAWQYHKDMKEKERLENTYGL